MKRLTVTAWMAAMAVLLAGPAKADTFAGTVYYTYYTGGANVWKVNFSYNDATATASLNSPVHVATTNGADGIIFAPNGNLLIGGQGSGNVYEVNPITGSLINTQATNTASYHLTLDPNLGTVYTSSFGGPLQVLNLPVGSGYSTRSITGNESGVTQVAFGTGGSVFYVNGNPNGFGNIGTVNLATGVTTRLYSGVQAAHGVIYDPFTGKMTFFGAGKTATMNAADGSGLVSSDLEYGVGDFDQGAVDGMGHALVAGSGQLTFIDYSVSHDITNPDHVFNFSGVEGISFSGIDDVAPLVGPGAPPTGDAPEPASLALLGLGAGMLSLIRRRKV